MWNKEDILDLETVQSLRSLGESTGKDLFGELLGLFESTIGDQLQQMQSAFGAEDFDLLANLSHTLKSSSGNLGATTISSMAAEIERQFKVCETPDLSLIEKHLDDLPSCVESTIGFLKAS